MSKKGNKKNSRLVTWILGFILLCLMLYLLSILMPLVLIGGLIGIWYFTKKKSDVRKRNIAIGVAVVGLIGSIALTPNTLKQQETTTTSLSTSVSISSSSEKSNSSSSEEVKTEESSTTESSSSEQEVKNDGPEYTEESNTQFATYLTDQINSQLSASGYQVSIQPVGSNLLYVYVPQEIKYCSKSEIQQVADGLYSIKEDSFTNWAIDNGYDLGFTYSPSLYVKSADDTTLAEEALFSKSMKVKVNN